MHPLILGATGASSYNHRVWNYVTPMVRMEPNKWTAGVLRDWRNVAINFHDWGLVGQLGEAAVGDWVFDGITSSDYGRAVIYLTDMFNAYYTDRGITHDSYYAWWPQGFGTVESGAENPGFMATQALWYMNGYGPTADKLNLYTWTGATTNQNEVLLRSPFINLTSGGFSHFLSEVVGGMLTARDLEERTQGLSYPSLLAIANEQYLGAYTLYQNGDGANDAPEMGTWIQSLNDSRASTYKFFGKNLTLLDLWGATGPTSSSLRSPGYQYTIPMGLSAVDNRGSFDYGATSHSVEVVWDNSRGNTLDYQPNWDNWTASFYTRHRQHLIHSSYLGLKNLIPYLKIGNYQDIPSSKLYPDRTSGKLLRHSYTCDVDATGQARALSGHGTNSGVTGTFPYDNACPVLYVPVGDSDSVGYNNFLPGIGSGFLRNRHSGAYGTSGILTYSGSGIFASGSLRATYVNWLQRISADGMTTVSGTTADGYSGNNLSDLRRWWVAKADSKMGNAYRALHQFADNDGKSVIPWLSSNAPRYTSIFGPTGNWNADPTPYPDIYGLTGYTVPSYDPTVVDFNVSVIKNAIKNYDVSNFYLFCSDLTSPTLTMDFWDDVIQTLILDSESETGGQTGGGETGGGLSSDYGVGMLNYYPSVSRIVFGGRIYTREEFEQIVDVFYGN